MASDDFKVAFSAATVALEPKSDPNYMRWVARFRKVDNGLATEENIPLHVCSDEEIASFDEPLSSETADLVNKF